MTNREAHERAAGMGLDPMFFRWNDIDPNAEYDSKTDPLEVCEPSPLTTAQEGTEQ